MTDWAGATDQVIFVVPPHLRDIRLNIPAAQDQKIIHISRTIVQESWIATLHATASRILTPMLAGRRVLVISQCGPFTVLLGLFLAQAADELGLNPGQLAYFDLGQVTDFANVEQAERFNGALLGFLASHG